MRLVKIWVKHQGGKRHVIIVIADVSGGSFDHLSFDLSLHVKVRDLGPLHYKISLCPRGRLVANS